VRLRKYIKKQSEVAPPVMASNAIQSKFSLQKFPFADATSDGSGAGRGSV
jgi:hypothetical protein